MTETPNPHTSVAMDRFIGEKIPVLDDGFVRVIDYMGTDASIVQAARISYGAGTKTTSEDRDLIRYLMRNWHTTPFEMCEVKFHVRVPMDVWRQWIRHRTASVNEYSTRYSEAIDSAAKTGPLEWRPQSGTNKQGSEVGEFLPMPEGTALTRAESNLQAAARRVYEERLAAGVAREQARKDLPLSTYTEAYWKIDVHNLLHFLRLRLDTHAQKEIRDYAQVIAGIVAAWLPHTWGAFSDYRLHAMSLTYPEIQTLREVFADRDLSVFTLKGDDGSVGDHRLKGRERREFLAKLESLGIRWSEVE